MLTADHRRIGWRTFQHRVLHSRQGGGLIVINMNADDLLGTETEAVEYHISLLTSVGSGFTQGGLFSRGDRGFIGQEIDAIDLGCPLESSRR